MGRPPTDPVKLKEYKAALKAWKASQGEAAPRKKPAKKAALKAAAADKPKKAPKPKSPKAPAEPKEPKPPVERQGGTGGGREFGSRSQQKNLSAADLPAIIALFQSLGVQRLTGAGFDIKLTASTSQTSGERATKPGAIEGATANPANPPQMQVGVSQEDLRDMEMSQKLIDSPLEYEQAQIDAHLGQDDAANQQEDNG